MAASVGRKFDQQILAENFGREIWPQNLDASLVPMLHPPLREKAAPAQAPAAEQDLIYFRPKRAIKKNLLKNLLKNF